MNTLTPVTTKALVAAMLEEGYIEKTETYPVVAELPTGFLFIAHEQNYTDDGSDLFIVSEFVTTGKHPDFSWKPHNEAATFNDALAQFHAVFKQKLIA